MKNLLPQGRDASKRAGWGPPQKDGPWRLSAEEISRKGTNGISTNGVTANFIFFERGTIWVLLLTYFYLPKSARAYLFPHSVKIHYFCSGPISVDPICPQPNLGGTGCGRDAASATNEADENDI